MTNTDRAGDHETPGDVEAGAQPFPISGPWDRETLATFLEDTTVPIRLACRTPGGGLWMVSLWYRYRDGELQCATSASADVVSFLRADPQVAFEISVNETPYKGVRGQGTVTIESDPDKETLRGLIDRYLGDTDAPLAQKLLDGDREEVRLRIDVSRAATWDYSDRMAGSED